jgi:hypothetical protein
MRFRRPESEGKPGESGFGSFLRSLLAGVPWSERAETEEITNLDRPPSGLLRIHNANGSTRVIGEERADIQVKATKVARAESAEAAAELLESIRLIHGNGHALDLEVDVPGKWNRRGHVNLEISVPKGTSVEVIASNGRVGIECLRAAVRARSSNGAVDISDVVGDVEVATSNAKVCCTCTCGRLVARSSNGKIELEEHRGSVDASTSNGLIRASMEAMGEDGVQLATSNGRIVLELPDEVDGEVDIRVDNGVIRNERKLCKATRERTGQLRGRLGAGGAPIKLRTSNGSVSLR